MDKLKKLEEYTKVSNEIYRRLNERNEYAKRPKHYDKLGMGFVSRGGNFTSFSTTLAIDSWVGTYGHSGSSTIFNSLDNEIFKKAFFEELNSSFYTIMKNVAKRIEDKANEYKDETIKELESKLKSLKDE